MAGQLNQSPVIVESKKPRKDNTHWLYIGVIIAVLAGIGLGVVSPSTGKSLAWIGTTFVSLVKMMIAPVIFCTIVLGIGSVRAAASVGKAGGIALTYFITMSTFALGIGLLVGNMLHPGGNLHYRAGAGQEYANKAQKAGEGAHGLSGFLQSIVPESLFNPLVGGTVLQTLFVALLVGFAVQQMGKKGEPILAAVAAIQKLVFRILTMVLWIAPLGAFGAMAGVVGATGLKAVGQMMILMVGFYITCALFIIVILGGVLKIVTGQNVFKLMKYLGREYLLIFATSSSESALPNLMAKMEHVGVEKATVGIVVPTGYSFNLDGTAIYLTMASIFISNAMGKPMDLKAQIGLLVFMIIASKGAAGVSGAGLATLAGGLQSHNPALLDGVGIIVGIDRFMSEARAITNFSGNAIATLVVGKWTKTIDMDRVHNVLDGKIPFDYATLQDDDDEVTLGKVPHPSDVQNDLPATPYPILPEQKH